LAHDQTKTCSVNLKFTAHSQ